VGARTDPERLARVCWFLALLTEAHRGGPAVAMAGSLGKFRIRQPSVDEVLHMAPKAAIAQLAVGCPVSLSATRQELAQYYICHLVLCGPGTRNYMSH
jgi:hypothetical protein